MPCETSSPTTSSQGSSRFGVLTKSAIAEHNIVRAPGSPDNEQIPEECRQLASYDLRLGREYFIPNSGRWFHKISSKMFGAHGVPEFVPLDCFDGEITIPRFSSAFVSSYEELHLPSNVAGRFNLRFKMALRGLIVQMGTQIEPGYIGNLYAMLQNISDKPIVLKYKDLETRPFSIEFHYTHVAAEVAPKDSRRKYFSMKDLVPKERAHGTINTIVEDLKKAQDDIKNSAAGKFSITAGFWMVFIAAAVALVASSVPTYITAHFASGEIASMVKNDIEKEYQITPQANPMITDLDNRLLELERKNSMAMRQERSKISDLETRVFELERKNNEPLDSVTKAKANGGK